MPKVSGENNRNQQGSQQHTGNKPPSEKQMELLLDFLEINPAIVEGTTRNRTDAEAWRSAAEFLNPYGPPAKDGSGWKATWEQYRNNLKEKILQNGAGGELSPIEVRAAVLANIFPGVGEAPGDVEATDQADAGSARGTTEGEAQRLYAKQMKHAITYYQLQCAKALQKGFQKLEAVELEETKEQLAFVILQVEKASLQILAKLNELQKMGD